MDQISLHYFSEMCRDLNITKTAARLYMSQQTLSNHLQRMEEELGVTLFQRKGGLKLTPAGEQFLNYARSATREYENLKGLIADIEHQDRGSIRFGASTLRISSCLPAILPAFAQKYPHVELRITDSISRYMVPRIVQGDLDMAIVILQEEHPSLKATVLMDDWLYLCVPEPLLRAYYPDTADELKKRAFLAAHLADFAELPFCLFSNQLGDKIRGLFDDAHVLPKTFLSSTYTQIGVDLCMQGLAACVATQMNLKMLQKIPDNINIFPLYHGDAPQAQTMKLIRRRDRYLPSYALYFIDLLTEYFQAVEAAVVKRKA